MSKHEDLYEGRRLSYEGALCTVRYIGPLAGTKGLWLGVEWDDSRRGKHNGLHHGQQIFQCLRPSSDSASFIRPTRTHDPSRTLLEAIRHKYGQSSTTDGSKSKSAHSDVRPVLISGKVAEEIGFDKVQRQISNLSGLRIALLDQLVLRGIAKHGSSPEFVRDAQAEIARICPEIAELDLGWNTLDTWEDVADICLPLDRLRILKTSGLRLRTWEGPRSLFAGNAFNQIEELQLNECLLRPTQILRLLGLPGPSMFPSLKALSLSQNELHNFSVDADVSKGTVDSVSNLVLENNHFTNLEPLQDILAVFPNATSLSLQSNNIKEIGLRLLQGRQQDKSIRFPKMETLNISLNQISDFTFVDEIPTLFPNLTSLRISRNPLYASLEVTQNSANKPADSTYYLTLARIPNLKSLNYTIITERDREEGEIYYLFVAEKDITSIIKDDESSSTVVSLVQKLDGLQRKYPLYEALCTKHERTSIFTRLTAPSPTLQSSATVGAASYAPGTLGARLLDTTFYIPTSSISSSSTHTFTRLIPRTISVYRLKALVARHFHLAPLQMKVVYESEELDPVREDLNQGSQGRNNWAEWGQWDVDDDGDLHGASKEVETDLASTSTEHRGQWHQDTQSESMYLLKDGKRWKRREVVILDGMRAWGDFVDDENVRMVNVRVEPFDSEWEARPWGGI